MKKPILYRKAYELLFFILLAVVFAERILGEGFVPEESSPTNFVFKKHGRMFPHPPEMRKPGPYYTCLVKMKDVKDFPYDYALYFSTDHGKKGGIWMWVCTGSPTVSENWTSYDQALADSKFDYLKKKPAANPIFIDRTQGSQTETPHANIIDDKVYMTYHNAGAGRSQSTLMATSEDGVNFSRINGDRDSVILDYEDGPGNGHTGYFRWTLNPFSGLEHKYVGYSLHGGGDNSHSAMWASNDAISWDRLEVFNHIEGDAIENGRFIKWPEIDTNSITRLGNGEYIAICVGGTRSSGGKSRVNELYEIFLAHDCKTITRMARKILKNGPSGANDEEELSQPTSVQIGNTWHLIYVGTRGSAGVNTVMSASGMFDNATAKSRPLKSSEHKRHHHRK